MAKGFLMPTGKIILISPYPDTWAFGIRMLSASLKHAGHDVRVIFLPNGFQNRYEETTLRDVASISEGSCLIGISVMTNFFDNAVQLTQYLKKHLNIPVIWGGIHPTIRPVECLDYADLVCVGEGEKTILNLAAKICGKEDYRSIHNIWIKDGSKVIKNDIYPIIEDLDALPYPDYDFKTHYTLKGKILQTMDQELFELQANSCYVTMPTRGCPFSCSYCCNNALKKLYPNQKPFRKRSLPNIISELSQMKKRMPFIKMIRFDDDAFFSYSLKEIEEFCDSYKAADIGLPLSIGGATPGTVSKEKLRLLIDAGLARVRMGIQTSSERLKILYNRHYSNREVLKAIDIISEFPEFKSINRLPQYDIILDNPWETEKDLIETLMFLTKIPAPYQLAFFSLTFYPDTDLYVKAKQDGIVVNDLEDVYRKHYHHCADTYLNKLFLLVGDYATWGGRLSPNLMRCLVSSRLRKSGGLNKGLYFAVRLWVTIFNKLMRVKYLARESFLDLSKGDWSRIKNRVHN